MSGKPGQSRESDEEIIERFLALVRSSRSPTRAGQKYRREAKGSGAAKWVNGLYDQIVTMRAAGHRWKDVAACLAQAKVPLEGAASWNEEMVRRLFNKERQRRARALGTRPVVEGVTDASPAPALSGLEPSSSRAMAVHERAAEAIKPATDAQSPTTAGQGGQSRWQTRMSLDPRPKAPKPSAAAPAPQATERPRQTKPGRKWDPGDELEYWGKVPPDMRLIGPPPDWDGISTWSDDQGGWRHPDGTVRPAQKINRSE